MTRIRSLTAGLLVAAVVAGCGGGSDATVVVSAASSLTDAFADLATEFETANPGIDVVVNVAASSTLREQILGGAPVDVFASADTAVMEAVASRVGEPAVFATNHLVIAVPAGNPADISGPDDFSRDDLVLGLCVEAAPCGALAREALDRAGVVPEVDSAEPNVRALSTKIAAGEFDAGIVYVTDVLAAAGSLEAIDLAHDVVVTIPYPIAIVDDAPNRDGGAAFVAFVLSPRGAAILAEYGFGPP